MSGAGGAQRYQIVAAHQACGLLSFFMENSRTTALERESTIGMDESFVRVGNGVRSRTLARR